MFSNLMYVAKHDYLFSSSCFSNCEGLGLSIRCGFISITYVVHLGIFYGNNGLLSEPRPFDLLKPHFYYLRGLSVFLLPIFVLITAYCRDLGLSTC
jgi:hypothetical protein